MDRADAPIVGSSYRDSPTVGQLNEVLDSQLGDARVTSVLTEPIGTGQMSESRRLRLTYSKPCDLPSSMIAKFPSIDEKSRLTGKLTRCYEVEASFYRDLHEALDVAAPRCFHVERNDESDDFLLLLEDFAPCRQGDQISGCSPDDAHACIDELVKLHGPLWNSSFLSSLAWLNRSNPTDRSQSQALLQALFPGFLDRYYDWLTPEARSVGEQFVNDSGSYFRRQLPHRTVVHGDFRLDNLLFRDGRVGVVDFQTVTHACGAQDLAYFIGAGLTTSVRRSHEHELVQHWVEGLRGYNVTIGIEDAWAEYRKFTFAGYVMAVIASMIVKQTDRGDDMFVAMANRHAQHAVDLDSLDAVRS